MPHSIISMAVASHPICMEDCQVQPRFKNSKKVLVLRSLEFPFVKSSVEAAGLAHAVH